MSVLNGQLASYVDSEVIRKQVDIISGASSEGAVSTTLTSSAASRTGSSISSAPHSPDVEANLARLARGQSLQFAPCGSARQPGRAHLNDVRKHFDAELAEQELEDFELEDLHLGDLFAAFERIAASIDLTRVGDHMVEYDDTPISLHQEDIVDRLTRIDAHRLTLGSVFDGRTHSERIGLFLALLELVRQGRVRVRQDDLDDDIDVTLAEERGPDAPTF